MTRRLRTAMGVLGVLMLATGPSAPLRAQNPRVNPAAKKGVSVTHHAKGTFEVKLKPQSSEKKEGASIDRMSIDKVIHGDLEGSSKGEMLSAMTDVKGSAGYVAIERVIGTLNGKTGSFVLQHSGTMTRGTPHLIISVVPDSGTGGLTGITGKLEIKIADGNHSYEFAYELPDAH